MATPGLRAAPVPVALKVSSRQGPSIAEEWTAGGTMRFETAVLSRSWKKSENKAIAHALARALDVASDSGQDLGNEPWAEVQLRELVATWYQDKTSDSETADYLRESALSTFGIPKSLWIEAKEFRKLRGAGGPAQ